MNKAIRDGFAAHGWNESRIAYWVTSDAKLIRKTMFMDEAQQKAEIEAAGFKPLYSYNQTDFVKERAAVEVQFGKYAFVAYDLFVKHLAFFVGDVFNLIEPGDGVADMRCVIERFLALVGKGVGLVVQMLAVFGGERVGSGVRFVIECHAEIPPVTCVSACI